MKIFQILLFATAVSLFSSCHKQDTVPHGSIFDNEINPPSGAYDFSPELTDGSTRYVSPDLTLRYADGGVLVQRNETDGRTRYSMVELSTGHIVEFSCRTPVVAGMLDDVRLTIDGADARINGAHVHRINSTGAWIEILAPGDRHYVLVVTDI